MELEISTFTIKQFKLEHLLKDANIFNSTSQPFSNQHFLSLESSYR